MTRPDPPTDRPSAAAARRTPYELVFQPEEFEARIFPRIRDEAAERGVDPLHPDRFAFLSVVGDTVREVAAPEAGPDAMEQYRALLFHAYNFWRFGKPVYLLDPPVARYLVEAAPSLDDWDLTLPRPTVYLQLPGNLFWSSISTDSPPEPVDGFFATAVAETDALGKAFTRLSVLAVLGIRRDRAGFGVMPFETETGPGIAAAWADAPGRESGRDFENLLPGGDLANLYSILTSVEALKLLARAFWYVDAFPEQVVPGTVAEGPAGGTGGAPPPRLPYHRVTLGEPGGEG